MPREVKQRTKSDCGIAAVANATGTTYKAVKEKFGRMDRHGLNSHEIGWLIGHFADWHEVRVRRHQTLEEWVRRHPKGRYVVSVRQFLDYHAVAVVDGRVVGHHRLDSVMTEVLKIDRIRTRETGP